MPVPRRRPYPRRGGRLARRVVGGGVRRGLAGGRRLDGLGRRLRASVCVRRLHLDGGRTRVPTASSSTAPSVTAAATPSPPAAAAPSPPAAATAVAARRRRVERLQRRPDPAAVLGHQWAVVLVGDLARAVVELEVAQGRQGLVALLAQREAPARPSPIASRRSSAAAGAQQRPRRARWSPPPRRRPGPGRAGRSHLAGDRLLGVPLRAAARLAAVGPGGDSQPDHEHQPGSQIRFTSGLISTLSFTASPLRRDAVEDQEQVLAGRQSVRIEASFVVCPSAG